jgi:hypothetical protein
MTDFAVRLVKDNVASIYESSRFASIDLKDHPRLVRRATALGRACMEPLAVLAALLGDQEDPEILALQLHPLQGMLQKEQRMRVAQQLVMTAVAQEGVSINECVQKDWLAPMLQFVPGLGPRKAQALVKVLHLAPPCSTRTVCYCHACAVCATAATAHRAGNQELAALELLSSRACSSFTCEPWSLQCLRSELVNLQRACRQSRVCLSTTREARFPARRWRHATTC